MPPKIEIIMHLYLSHIFINNKLPCDKIKAHTHKIGAPFYTYTVKNLYRIHWVKTRIRL